MSSGSLVSLPIAAACCALAAAPASAALYSYQVYSPSVAPAPQSIIDSTSPVSVSGTEVIVGFGGDPHATVTLDVTAAAGGANATGASYATLDQTTAASGHSEAFAQEWSKFVLDGIVITGPPGSTPADVVTFTTNISVSGTIEASGGPSPLGGGASAHVIYDVGGPLSGFAAKVGLITSSVGSSDQATGLFIGFPFGKPGSVTADSPSFQAHHGDTIYIGMRLETAAWVGVNASGGPGVVQTLSDFIVGLPTAGSVFDLPDGWTANSEDGKIVDNQLVPPCPADLDGNGAVDVTDLLAVLGAWGACPQPCPPACAADIDGDCTVGVVDLLALLGAWGACP